MVPPGAFRVPVWDHANAESGFLTYSSSPARAGRERASSATVPISDEQGRQSTISKPPALCHRDQELL